MQRHVGRLIDHGFQAICRIGDRGTGSVKMHTVHVVIAGRVQGVGYRAWVERQASMRGLDGWVRNRSDGTVEATFRGSAAAVEAMLAACRDGPRAALVSDVAVTATDEQPTSGFSVLPTA